MNSSSGKASSVVAASGVTAQISARHGACSGSSAMGPSSVKRS
jgi:hypothetical protein